MSDFIENFVKLDREKNIRNKRHKLTRREWLVKAPAALATVTMMPLLAQNMVGGSEANTDLFPEFPSQDPSLVREIVRVSHFDLERVRELVTTSPALAKAAPGTGDMATGRWRWVLPRMWVGVISLSS